MHSARGCSTVWWRLGVYVEVMVIGTCAWRPACVVRLRSSSSASGDDQMMRWGIGDAEMATSQTAQRRIFESAAAGDWSGSWWLLYCGREVP